MKKEITKNKFKEIIKDPNTKLLCEGFGCVNFFEKNIIDLKEKVILVEYQKGLNKLYYITDEAKGSQLIISSIYIVDKKFLKKEKNDSKIDKFCPVCLKIHLAEPTEVVKCDNCGSKFI